MRLYTETHVTAVFLFGVLNGVMGYFIVSELKSNYRFTKVLIKSAIRPYMRYLKKKTKLKVPTAVTMGTSRKLA